MPLSAERRSKHWCRPASLLCHLTDKVTFLKINIALKTKQEYIYNVQTKKKNKFHGFIIYLFICQKASCSLFAPCTTAQQKTLEMGIKNLLTSKNQRSAPLGAKQQGAFPHGCFLTVSTQSWPCFSIAIEDIKVRVWYEQTSFQLPCLKPGDVMIHCRKWVWALSRELKREKHFTIWEKAWVCCLFH